jgi:hypothetical protein
LQWTAAGFVFGFFFPAIRGSNGLEKAANLFLVLLLARLPIMLMMNESVTEWRASLFWMLQAFIQCILLGLVAFERVLLRRAAHPWATLVRFHGLTRVGVSLSSVVTAVAVSIATFAGAQATSILQSFVQTYVPRSTPAPDAAANPNSKGMRDPAATPGAR